MCKLSFRKKFPCLYNFTQPKQVPAGSGSDEDFPDPTKKVRIRPNPDLQPWLNNVLLYLLYLLNTVHCFCLTAYTTQVGRYLYSSASFKLYEPQNYLRSRPAVLWYLSVASSTVPCLLSEFFYPQDLRTKNWKAMDALSSMEQKYSQLLKAK